MRHGPFFHISAHAVLYTAVLFPPYFYALLTWQRWPFAMEIMLGCSTSLSLFDFLKIFHLCTDDEVKRNVNSLTRRYVFRGVLHELFMRFGIFPLRPFGDNKIIIFYDKWVREKITKLFLSRQSSHNHCLTFSEI